jgi:hypothetical protein
VVAAKTLCLVFERGGSRVRWWWSKQPHSSDEGPRVVHVKQKWWWPRNVTKGFVVTLSGQRDFEFLGRVVAIVFTDGWTVQL